MMIYIFICVIIRNGEWWWDQKSAGYGWRSCRSFGCTSRPSSRYNPRYQEEREKSGRQRKQALEEVKLNFHTKFLFDPHPRTLNLRLGFMVLVNIYLFHVVKQIYITYIIWNKGKSFELGYWGIEFRLNKQGRERRHTCWSWRFEWKNWRRKTLRLKSVYRHCKTRTRCLDMYIYILFHLPLPLPLPFLI